MDDAACGVRMATAVCAHAILAASLNTCPSGALTLIATGSPPVQTVGTCVSTALQIPGPAGRLEARLDCPPEARLLRAVAVVCHPHPLHGGTLSNKVVHTLARGFNELGAASVRFNFRGVGDSEGVYADTVGETADLLAVLAWVQARYPGLPVWLAGFSFGAYVALRAVSGPERGSQPDCLVTVAPPVNFFDFSILQAPQLPWLLVQGDADEIVPAQQVLDWAAASRPSPALHTLEGAGHFFHGRLNELRDGLREWMSVGSGLAPPA